MINHASKGFRPGFETHDRRHQKSSISGPTKRTDFFQNLKKINGRQGRPYIFECFMLKKYGIIIVNLFKRFTIFSFENWKTTPWMTVNGDPFLKIEKNESGHLPWYRSCRQLILCVGLV